MSAFIGIFPGFTTETVPQDMGPMLAAIFRIFLVTQE